MQMGADIKEVFLWLVKAGLRVKKGDYERPLGLPSDVPVEPGDGVVREYDDQAAAAEQVGKLQGDFGRFNLQRLLCTA